MKRFFYTLILTLTYCFSLAQVTIYPNGVSAECPGEEIIYNASVSSNESGCQFEWTVTNGVFNNNSDKITGNPVSVTWNSTSSTGKLSVKVFTCDLSSVDGIYTSSTITVKSIVNEISQSIEGPTNIPIARLTSVSYKIPKMYYPHTGGQGQPNFIEVDNYQWVIPSGWKLGSIISDGRTPIINQQKEISVIPDNCSGDGNNVKVRGYSSCGPGYTSKWRELTISRPIPSISFSQPPPDYLVCQETNSIAVTVSSIPGATYTWTKPNKWQGYSTSNTIVLTPDGITGGLLSVVANVCGRKSSILTKAIEIRLVDPNKPPSISGSSTLCTSNNTFSILNLPTGATVSWNASPASNFAIKNGSGLTFATRAVSSSALGQGVITASITTLCGTFNTSLNTWLGKPLPPSTSPSSYVTVQTGNVVMVKATSTPGSNISSLSWWVAKVSGLRILSIGPDYVNVEAMSKGSYYLYAKTTNLCGASSTRQVQINVVGNVNCGSYPYPPCYPSRIYPNPSVGFALLEFSDSIYENSLKKGYVVKVYNKVQDLVLEKKSNEQSWKINTQDLPKGLYILSIIYSEGVLKEKLIVE